FKRSLEISSEFDLYRQDYCGCVYSMNKMAEQAARKKLCT
ncbi:MAG: epoxyqueuosine reductase QueH, partial [Spirochaetaceae bacterium]|nr:epoxyqueuosine reductase QueH [Spirochaetaceae bacterium]